MSDYVTERLVNAYAAGTVPIIDGPEDYTSFVPTSKSVIRIDDFKSPKHLAEFIKSIQANVTEYLQYFSHKTLGRAALTHDFQSQWFRDRNKEAWGYSCLCRKAQHDLKTHDLQLHETHVLPDRGCNHPGKWEHLNQQHK